MLYFIYKVTKIYLYDWLKHVLPQILQLLYAIVKNTNFETITKLI